MNQDPESVLEKYVSIEANFNALINSAKIQLPIPDFVVVDNEKHLLRNNRIKTGWSKVCNKYDYALKINEIGDKYGRVQNIICDLEDLISLAPKSVTFNRLLGYFYRFVKKFDAAIVCYKTAVIVSNEVQDWFGLACIALEKNDTKLACLALEKYCAMVSPNVAPNIWYLYNGLVLTTGFYPSIEIFTENKAMTQDNWILILETGVYLLQKQDKKTEAKAIVREMLSPKSERRCV